MQHTVRVFRTLLFAAPISLALAACGDGGGSDDTTVIADAGADQSDGKAGAAGSAGSAGDASGPDAALDAADAQVVEDGSSDDAELDASQPEASQEDVMGPDAAEPDAAPDAPPEPPLPVQLRVVAANLTSANGQSYDAGHGIRILQGIHPDVVMIQEFKYGDNSDIAIRSFVDTAFAPTFSYYRETGALIPNGVISRYPIVEAGKWTDPEVVDRGFAWARINIPGPRDLWAVSVHLLNTGTAGERNNEAKALLANINTKIPSLDALVVVGGDMNTQSRTESCYDTLEARFVVTGPWPVDQSNNSNTNAKRQLPYDWVIASTAFDPLEVPVVVGTNSFPSGLVVDTRVYQPIADLTPALATDSAALNMQHMAVVRDFLIN